MLIAEPSPTGIAARPDLCHKQPYVEARHGFENYASSMQIGTALSGLDRAALSDAGVANSPAGKMPARDRLPAEETRFRVDGAC